MTVKRYAYLSHCLLNANAKVDELAKVTGGWTPIVGELRAAGYGIRQMPCPELAYGGVTRFWNVREQYDTPGFRRHCRHLLEPIVDAIEADLAAGAEVALIGLDGSPSDGVRVTSVGPDWGGKPAELDYVVTSGEGVFIAVLRELLDERGLPDIRRIGVAQDDPSYVEAEAVAELREFLVPLPVRRRPETVAAAGDGLTPEAAGDAR